MDRSFDESPYELRLIVNDSISLTNIRSSDKSAYLHWLQEKEIFDCTLRIPFPYTEADAEEWLSVVRKATEVQGQPVHFAIRNADGMLIGGCGFDGVDPGKSHRAEIGYWLAKPYWGRGIMTDVVHTACRHALDRFELVKIAAHVFFFNIASARVLEKCGFQQEGYLRKHCYKEGRYIDVKVYGLVK